MGQRRILVIGSQCVAEQQLSFLPDFAERFYNAMIDDERGQCVPALPEGGLVLDPTIEETDEKIRLAYRRASVDQATLFLAYVGHGQRSDTDFFLMPKDATLPPTMRTAVYLVQLIREEFHREATNGGALDGLVVLLDACSAGAGLPNVAANWVHEELKRSLRFELLTATGDNPAYDGCFTRILTELLLNGDAMARCPKLRTLDCTTPLFDGCKHQQPRILVSSYGPDRGLWLMRNRAFAPVVEPWLRLEISEEIIHLTSYYQPPALLAQLPALLEANRAIALIGPAGAGKSALIAALARPEVTHGAIAPGFLSAVVFLTANITSEEVAGFLATQLSQSVPGFAACLDDFKGRTQHTAEWSSLDALHRKVIGPLRLLGTGPLRIAIDGLDQAPGASWPVIIEFLGKLATDKTVPFVRVILTARPDTPLPAIGTVIALDRAPEDSLRKYFGERKVPLERIGAAIFRADGSWLVAELLADLAERDPSGFDPAGVPPGLPRIYEAALLKAGVSDLRRWREEFRPVLSVLAVAGAGPVLPFPLFRRACQELEGPQTNSRLRDVLVDLRGFVIRVSPGDERERVGLFHATLAEHLSQPGHATSVEPKEGHQALLTAIQLLAPVDQWNLLRPDPIQSYAFRRHAEHLWAVGRRKEVVPCLASRQSNVPQENLNLWMGWLQRISQEFNGGHADTLTTRSNIAYWMGKAREAREALRLYQELLSDQQRVLGADHPDTLRTRGNIARLAVKVGEAREALRLSRELLLDQQRVLGADHPDTLRTRGNIAASAGHTGEPREALRLFQELLPDLQRVLGADHHDTLITRNNIAYWMGRAGGEARELLRVFQELLLDQQRVLGADHPETLTTRNNIAASTAQTGEAREALRLFQELLRDQQRILGADHPDTLRTRNNIAYWIGETGEARKALQLFRELLPDRQRVLGTDHPGTLITRNNIAYWTGQTGEQWEARWLFQELLPDRKRVLGADHPATLTTRSNVAYWTGQTGDAREALRLYQELLPDQQRVLGADHPDTLTTRNNIAYWTGQTGEATEALRLFQEVLRDRQRVLGADHPDTLTTRNNIVNWTGQTGDAREALRLYQELLLDQQRVLGAEHPATLMTLSNIAYWTGQTGEAREELRLFEELLPICERVLGPSHPYAISIRERYSLLQRGQSGH